MRGDRLKAERESIGYTQEQLAERIGVSLRSLIRYEDGNEVASDVLAKLVVVFGCTADYLLGLVDERTAAISVGELTPLQRRLLLAIDAGFSVEAMDVMLRLLKESQARKEAD